MQVPLARTPDGFESQLATNYITAGRKDHEKLQLLAVIGSQRLDPSRPGSSGDTTDQRSFGPMRSDGRPFPAGP